MKPPVGESIAAFCFQDLAQVSGACVKEMHTQTLGEALCPGRPGMCILAESAIQCICMPKGMSPVKTPRYAFLGSVHL